MLTKVYILDHINGEYVTLLKKESQGKAQGHEYFSLKQVPIEERHIDAEKPLFLRRYE
jgi:hypothetical protein